MNDLAQVSLEAPKLCLCGCELSARGSEPELTTKDSCNCGCGCHEGLALEARCFGEVCATQDMRIGVANFLANGPRAKAEFVHD